MAWFDFLKTDKAEEKKIELALYASFSKPTIINKDGRPARNGREAEKVKGDFLEMDSSDYGGLLKKAFSESGIDEIDERFYYKADNMKSFGLAANGTKIEASSLSGSGRIKIFANNGQKYTFSRQESGAYSFFGKLSRAYYDELVEPNAPLRKESTKVKDCFRMQDGECSATLPPNAAVLLMKRLVSDLVPVAELPLYGRPTKVRKKGSVGLNVMEAREVRDHFLAVDEAHGGLFGALGDMDEIEEINYGRHDDAVLFAVTHKGLKINASHDLLFNDMIVLSVNGKIYEFSKPAYPSEVIPQGHYHLYGELNEKDYNELMEPNAAFEKDESDGGKAKKSCWRSDDGRCGGTIKAEVVPELMKRIISYSKEGRAI